LFKKKVPPVSGAELRSVAEERLGEKPAINLPTVGNPLALLHELQVHQIELEMQNEELRRARSEVETALENYTDLYDFAPVGYVTLDSNGTIRAANLTCSNLVDVERSKLIGRRFVLLVANEARPAFAEFLEKVFSSRARERCEVALLKQGVSGLFVQIEGVAGASGEECRIVLIDISERKRAEEAAQLEKAAVEVLHQANIEVGTLLREKETTTVALNQANNKLEELTLVNEAAEALYLAKEAASKIHMASEAALELRLAKELADSSARTKNLFFANMSHELRTPLSGILGMLQVALREDLAPTPRQCVESALSQARSLLYILNDILDMSKIEAGKLAIEEKPFSLRKCLTEAADLLSSEISRKGLDFAVKVAETLPETVAGDHARLRQILINLIGNAVKFTETGRVEVRVTAAAATPAGKRQITFSVTDTGIGIPEEKKGLIFQTFSQVDASHNRIYGGTGLGLAICREIVELMGGVIGFESEAGVGSTFIFTVPFGEVGLESIVPAAPASPVIETMTDPDGERISHLLLAEDEPHNRKALGMLLQWANFKIDFAEDGQKAVEMWEQGEYDLVLMDIQMPRFNGFEATRAIRRKERKRGGHTPIIAMTAHAFKEDEERCLAGGMDYYISKPIDIDKCIKLIRQAIRQKSGGVDSK